MAIKYVEVKTQKWDTWLVALNDEEFPTEKEQHEAAYDAVADETEYDEAEGRSLAPEVELKYTSESMEEHYARHYGKDHIIDWTDPIE